MELQSQIIEYLKLHPNSNAKQIAIALSSDKTNINSILYAQKDKIFTLHATKPPTWSIKTVDATKIELSIAKFRILKTSKPIHIDFQGGDWAFTIQISDTSRNDPIVTLERTGPKSAIAKVSSSVINDTLTDSDDFPDVVLALASSALAWEIAIQSDAVLEEKFSFQDAIKDIYLSLGAHDIRTKGGNLNHDA
jgi:hypothetical protein